MDACALWKDLNRSKYTCAACRFRTYNLTHYERHCDTAKHFLLNGFAKEAPLDIKAVVASFLPVWIIFGLPPKVSQPALRLAWPQAPRHSRHPLPYLYFGPFASPRAPSAASEDREPGNGRSLISLVTL